MKTPANLSVRPYEPADREAVRRIAYETSFLGKPELFLEDREMVADALTLYFTDYEPESCLVAVCSGDVVGYLTGARSARRMMEIFNAKILRRLLWNTVQRRSIFKMSFLKFIWNVCKSFIKGEFRMPGYDDTCQALYHINLQREFRVSGIGSRLVRDFEEDLIYNHVYNVHVATLSDEAKEFFVKNGYQILFKSRRSYFKYKLNKIVPFYVLGKQLDRGN